MAWRRLFASGTERKAEQELAAYVAHLEELPDDEICGVLREALVSVKHFVDAASPYDDILLALRSGGCRSDLAALALNDLMQGLGQRRATRRAASFAPWLHTLRAYNFPHLRRGAGAMWKQLLRGESRLHERLSETELAEVRPFLDWVSR